MEGAIRMLRKKNMQVQEKYCSVQKRGHYLGNSIRGLWVIEIPIKGSPNGYRYRPMPWPDMCRIWKAYYNLGVIVGLYRLGGNRE